MKKTSCTLPEVFRRIQEVHWISKTPDKHTPEEIKNAKEELAFYKSVLKCFISSLDIKAITSIEEIVLKDCPLEKAQELARSIGLYITEGGSGAAYLSWSNSILED